MVNCIVYQYLNKAVWGFPGGSAGKCACKSGAPGDTGFDPWVGKIPLEEGMATHSSILAWRITCTEEPGGLQFIGWQSIGRD